jgi:hypothetical protein
MSVSFDFINGLCFGIEYVGKNLDEGIDESVVILEFACIRAIIWTGDYE